MGTRSGFDAMSAEITKSGGRFGGAWGPADLGCYHPRLIEFLVSMYPIRSVLDVGCGYGSALKHFRALGCNVIGIEGLAYAAQRCNVPVIVHDMEAAALLLSGIDLSYSIEAAEHISKTEHFLDTMCCAPVVCFSAAQPGQVGHHHVSCYPREWWIECMIHRGFHFEEQLSEYCQSLAGGYFGMTGMLFVKRTHLDGFGCVQGEFRGRG